MKVVGAQAGAAANPEQAETLDELAPRGVELPADAMALERRVDEHLGPIQRAPALGVVVREHAVDGEVFPAVQHVVSVPEHDEARAHADHLVLLPVNGDELPLREDT